MAKIGSGGQNPKDDFTPGTARRERGLGCTRSAVDVGADANIGNKFTDLVVKTHEIEVFSE